MGVLWTWSRVGGGEKKGGKVAQREWAQRWMLARNGGVMCTMSGKR